MNSKDAHERGTQVLLTGVSSGIGLALAKLFTERGYAVMGLCRDAAQGRAQLRAQGLKVAEGTGLISKHEVDVISCDLRDAQAVETAFALAASRLGGTIDILVNNAGSGELGAVEETPLSFAREMFEVNYFSAVRLTQLVLPGMRERRRGAILNLGSIVFSLQFPFKAQYCASKSALSAFTLSLRYEVWPHGIRVHLFEPGWVRSDFHNRLKPIADPEGPYASRLKPFLDYSRDKDPRIPDGMSVAETILETLERPQAPVRIAVGREAKRFFWVSRLLSHSAIDKILRWKLVKKGGSL